MSNRVGYARVSTADQNPQLQIDALEAAGVGRVFVDRASGATTDRPQLIAMLDYLRPGDTLVVWKLDRLGRSLRDLVNLLADLDDRDVSFHALTDGIDTSTAAGRMVAGVIAALAEYERSITRERTLAGLASARARGRKGGRPRVMTEARVKTAHELRQKGMTLQAVADTLGVGRATVVRALAQQD